MTLSQNGTAYDLIGKESAPIMVLIHGLGLCRKLWQPFIEGFSQDYRVLNYDLYGHGESEPAPETASLDLYTKQILDLMDELEIEQAALVGFSIGGMINRRFVLDYPQRVSALAILNSPHERGGEAQVQVEERARQVVEEGPMATMDAAIERWFTPEFREAHADQTQLVRDWRKMADVKTYPQACMVLAAGVKELIRPQTPIEALTLIMTCENDSGSTPAMSHAIAEEIAQSEIQIIPDLQHLGMMEEPQLFAKPILEFLDRKLN